MNDNQNNNPASMNHSQAIAIIGAGHMGVGITHVAALSGHKTILIDKSNEKLKNALATIHGNIQRQLSRDDQNGEQLERALNNITSSVDLQEIESADIIIEAVTEDEKIKRDVFHQVCSVIKDEAIIASNTSTISITRLAASTDRPEKFIGMHFMNPVPLMELVEIIRGIATDNTTFEKAAQFIKAIDKNIAVSEDFPAFIVQRIMVPMINESIYTLYEGVGTVEAIDTAMRHGAHHPMGPLELADFIGLDSCLSIMQTLYEGLADPKYRPCPLLVKYVEAGWLGKKAGRGFYDYRGDKPIPTR